MVLVLDMEEVGASSAGFGPTTNSGDQVMSDNLAESGGGASAASLLQEAEGQSNDLTDDAAGDRDSDIISDVTFVACTSASTNTALPNDRHADCGTSQLLAAMERGDAKQMKFILTNSSNPCELILRSAHSLKQPLEFAFTLGSRKIIQILMRFLRKNDRIHEMNSYTDNMHSVIHGAVINDNITVLITVLQTRIDSIIFHKTANGDNILHLATYYGNINMVATILNEGHLEAHDVRKLLNARNNKQEQPLHVAAQEGHSDIAVLLYKKGAHLESKSGNEQTPLLMAAVGGEYEMMTTLLKMGADANVVTADGESALEIIINKCSASLLYLLLKQGAELNDNVLQTLQPAMMKDVLDRSLSVYPPPSVNYANYCVEFVSPFGRNMSDVKNFLNLARSEKFQHLTYHPALLILIELKFISMREKNYTLRIDFHPAVTLEEKAALILQLDGSFFASQPHEQGISEADFCMTSGGHCLRSGPRALETPFKLAPEILVMLVELFRARGVTLNTPQEPRQRGCTPFIL